MFKPGTLKQLSDGKIMMHGIRQEYTAFLKAMLMILEIIGCTDEATSTTSYLQSI